MIRKICLLGLGLTLCLSFCSSSLKAQTILGSVEDTTLRSVSGGPVGDTAFGRTNRNGTFIFSGRFVNGAGDSFNCVALYRFELPDLGAVANPFATADFEFSYISSLTGEEGLTNNLDLYGIGLRTEEDQVLAMDYFVGPGPDSRITVVTLQEDILSPASEVGRISSVDIADYLNTLYDSGNGVGQFVTFRLSPDYVNTDLVLGVTNRYNLATANNPNATLQPIINFTTGDAPVLLGDVNLDSEVDFSDIAPFIAILSDNDFQAEADIDMSGAVDFLDIAPFIAILSGSGS